MKPTFDLAQLEAVRELQGALVAQSEARRENAQAELRPSASDRTRRQLRQANDRLIAARHGLDALLLPEAP